MKTKPNEEFLNAMSKDLGNWKGIFYFNKKDPRLIVPKLLPAMGMTLNFANPYAYIITCCIIIIIAFTMYFL
jgi:uncharacterized membrane protein